MHDPGAKLSRRDALRRGATLAAGVTLLPSGLAERLERAGLAGPAHRAAAGPQEVVVPWLDAPEPGGRSNTLDWEGLTSWTTPNEDLFSVGHYGQPDLRGRPWSLEVSGLVDRPLSISLEQLKARPSTSVTFALECAGNRGFPTFMGAVHNAEWTGTSLASLLEYVGVQDEGIEVVFFGADRGEEEIRGTTVTQNFARSMSIEDAMDPRLLLAYEVNGEELPVGHGYPLRLVAPGWYGVANVKWLTRIEVRSTRFMGRFMARDYVTLREETRDGESVWTESSVGRARINSIPARVVVAGGARYHIEGAAWGADIASVEVRIDDGPWREATLGEGRDDPYSWTFWRQDWAPASGEHTVTSRAIARDGSVQPAPDDPWLAGKRTYWESNGQVTRRITV